MNRHLWTRSTGPMDLIHGIFSRKIIPKIPKNFRPPYFL
jgi:hypothetical protein